MHSIVDTMAAPLAPCSNTSPALLVLTLPILLATFANHGGCRDTGRSTGAYIVKIGTGIVSWMSKRQSIVALSTTEAEYMAACEAGKEIIWMRKMLQELGFHMTTPSVLYMDNQSASR
jgi:hypothetical protein